ncbi:ABC transporter permease [Neobacillus niacini]|uniref:ABC transporter permease n=1 Tax=Neobacillus niacini TaxID=86668 RepID=UPI002866A32B|nr:ABC transporter permease [Neobacillus niacini]MDR7001312.1 ABC-2 type transport system permease protein [Neobacillus niacini]
MFDEKSLWNKRFGHRLKELGSYLRYIFNGHLVIVLVFLIGAAAFYYQNWIKTLSSGFPAELIIAVLIGGFLTYSPVYNFLLEADRVFLIPLETRLRDYFWRSGIVSLVFQGYILLMVQAVLMPMYAHVSSNGFHSFLLFFAVLLIVKVWNIAVSWKIHYFVQPSIYRWDMVVRYFINAVFTFLLFKQANFFILLVMLLVMGFYYWSFWARTRRVGLKWDLLIEQEEKRMAAFYRLANLFTDVPKLKDTVKRRKWLDFLLKRIRFLQKNTYLYLFSRTFLRSSDYLGLFVRLTVIGALALYFISFGFGQILLAVLFLYLTGFQLLPLWNHHQNKLWVDLYPVSSLFKAAAFQSLLLVVLALQAALFSLFILLKGDTMIALLELPAGLAFSYMFVYVYSRKRLKA